MSSIIITLIHRGTKPGVNLAAVLLCRIAFLVFALCVPAMGAANGPPPPPAPPPVDGIAALIRSQPKPREGPATAREKASIAAMVLAGIFIAFKLGPKIPQLFNRLPDPWTTSEVRADELSSKALAEQRSLSELAANLLSGPVPVAAVIDSSVLGSAAPETQGQREQNARNQLVEFFAKAPWKLALLRNLGIESCKPSNEKDRPKILADLSREIHSFKDLAGLPELLPAWQLASALEGLLKQLTDKPANVSPSTLRTTSVALTLLETLSVKGLKPNLATSPQVRLLVVDDDPIGRIAVSSSLKKVFNAPDVAWA